MFAARRPGLGRRRRPRARSEAEPLDAVEDGGTLSAMSVAGAHTHRATIGDQTGTKFPMGIVLGTVCPSFWKQNTSRQRNPAESSMFPTFERCARPLL